MSSVERIVCYSAKGRPGQRLKQVRLIEDRGMQGDYHATGGDRQITLISQKAKDWMESQEIRGLCFYKYHENIVTDDFILDDLSQQARFKIGEAVLELSPIRKKCFPQFCELDQNKVECLLVQEVRFAKVITGGNIAVGMEIAICGD